MTNNLNELKRAFEAECETAKWLVTGVPAHRSEYPVACVIVKLLQGYTSRNITGILREVGNILNTLRGDAELDTDKVYQLKVDI